MKLPNNNTIFLIVASLVVAGGLYWYFFTGSSPADTSFSTGAASSQEQARFEVLTSQLGPISFDLTILSDPRFLGLVDLATPVVDESVGRKDPFAPIPGVSAR